MSQTTRREFLRSAAATSISLSAASAAIGKTRGKRPVVAFVGCGGRAQSLYKGFVPDAEIAWACDPDESRAKAFQAKTGAKRSTADLRQVVQDDRVDAVVVATPDHWHAPAAIMACDHGKHVYVEKPCSHNYREGQLLVQAAGRNNVVVQHGTQSRNSSLIAGAIQMLREGIIGDVLMVKAWNVQRRANIGHASPSQPPANVAYDHWVGPAEFMPYQSNRFHYNWHWWHNFGTGDIGNDGAHEMDFARWGLGVKGLPTSVTALGGKYFFDDDQQFPDTATCAFEWPGDGSVGRRRQLIFEMRIWSKSYPYNCDSGAEFYGTEGLLFVSKRGKLQIFGNDNKPIKNASPKRKLDLPRNHQVDFLQAISEGRKPAADIAIGHDSVALIHLANIAIRNRKALQIDPSSESIVNDTKSSAMLRRPYRDGGHWSIPKGA